MKKHEIWYQNDTKKKKKEIWFWVLAVQIISFLTLERSLKIWGLKKKKTIR